MDADAALSHKLRDAARARPFSPALVALFLRVFDQFIMGGLGLAVYFIYAYPGHGYVSVPYLISIGLALLLTGLIAHWIEAYGSDLVMARHLHVDRVLVAWAITFGLLLSIAFALKITDHYSRVWALSWFISAMSLLAVGRALLGRRIAHLAAQGRFANRTAIVGIGVQAARLAAHLEQHDSVRTRILGLVDDEGGLTPDWSCRWPLLGGIDALIEFIRAGRVDQVFVALPWQEEARLRNVVQQLAVTPIAIRLAPDLAAFGYAGRSFVQIAGLPMLHVFDRPISGWSWFIKMAEDYLVAIFVLVILSPLLFLIALAIKLDSRGPILFRQHRQGFNNAPIEIWKFRTMRTDSANPEGAVIQATHHDPRVTRVGRFLRRLSLDELPQLVNVLRGEMSIVGPRPHAPGTRARGQLFEEAVERYAARHRVKPGITGWAQINGWRGETDTLEKIQKRVEHDLYYIDNWSIWLDLLIIVQTIAILFRDDRAY
jgi:Undecaprenyl-phosphate glucose phosphotransferase